MKQVLKFNEDLGDFIPFFCSSCNKMISNEIIIKIGGNYYKSPLCVNCNEAKGIKVENNKEQVKETRFNDALKFLLTTKPKPKAKTTKNQRK